MSSACFKVVCYTVCLGTCTGSITWKKGVIEYLILKPIGEFNVIIS